MRITMAHGSGGRDTAALIREVFLDAFGAHGGNGSRDAVTLDVPEKIAFTTDSFVVKPLHFPGGDIGRLAVCGTVNDLLTSRATPKYLSCGFILEEGLEIETLRSVVRSMAEAASEAGVILATGDTKVVEGAGGLMINTSGIGELRCEAVTFDGVRPGDGLIVTGNLGDHHACILSARMGIDNCIVSDVAPLCGIVSALAGAHVPLHGMRDITRGGLGTVLCELGIGAELDEAALPVDERVAGLCAMLGLDLLHMGCEGRMLIAVPQGEQSRALELIRRAPYGSGAAIVGRVTDGDLVEMRTRAGGRRLVMGLVGEGLARIC